MASDPFARVGPRLAAMLALWIAASISYLATAHLAAWLHPAPLLRSTPALPLLAWTLVPYSTLGLFTLAPVWACDPPAFRRLLRAAVLAMAVAYAGFVLCPMAVERGAVDGWWTPLYARLRSVDSAINSCPSLHIAYAGLVLACHRWRWWMWAWGAVIAASTLTTHQHVAIDVVGGGLLAVLAWRWAARIRPSAGAAA